MARENEKCFISSGDNAPYYYYDIIDIIMV